MRTLSHLKWEGKRGFTVKEWHSSCFASGVLKATKRTLAQLVDYHIWESINEKATYIRKLKTDDLQILDMTDVKETTVVPCKDHHLVKETRQSETGDHTGDHTGDQTGVIHIPECIINYILTLITISSLWRTYYNFW